MGEIHLGTSNNKSNSKVYRTAPYEPERDFFIYRVSVVTLAGVSLIGVCTIAALAVTTQGAVEVPQALTAVTSASLGALVTKLSSKR